MTEKIQIDQLIRSRRKSIELLITPQGELVVRAPLEMPQAEIETLVRSKANWVRQKQHKLRSLPPLSAPHQYETGEEFLFLGQLYPLQILPTIQPLLRFDNGFFIAQKAQPQAAKLLENWYRAQARRVLNERVDHYARQHEFQVSKVRISSARTRWGSCSSRGVLSFTWRLVMAPLDVIDYVVLHELVHLRVRNHSSEFWQAVSQLLPDYKLRREWLRQNGHRLDLGT